MTKSIIITGVNGGIGSAMAGVFYNRGYRVIGTDIKDKENDQCHDFIQFDLNEYCADISYRQEINELFNQKVASLDVLINNAAIQRLDPLGKIDLDDWFETLNVNLTGPLLLSQFFLDKLTKKEGSIINIGSIHQQLTKPRFISYATSKSGLIGLTKAMAVDLEGKVRVNAISPAAIGTPMLLEGFEGNREALDELKTIHPVQRIGYPEEVAHLAFFLAENNKGFIHGANISLDGGISSVLKDL